MARGSSWFKVKRAKLQRQMRNPEPATRGGCTLERDKPLNQTHFTLGAANTKRALVGAAIKGFEGNVVKGPRGEHKPMPGKGGRKFEKSTYGNFKPRTHRAAALDWDSYSMAHAGTIVSRPE